MPELPEVETIVRSLRPALVGLRITDVRLDWPRHTPDPDEVYRSLPGRTITGLARRGKYILIFVDPSDRTLLIHLGMSGRLGVVPGSTDVDQYAHTIFFLTRGEELRFSDARKFGRVLWMTEPGEVLDRLGPEPLSGSFTSIWLAEQLVGRRRAIKPLLLEQRFIAGLGNIYADEVLHRAGIDPQRPANSLLTEQVQALYVSIRQVIREAILHQGTSFDWVYPNGGMQARLRVYGRTDQPCQSCGAPIKRIVLGQRSTHYCPCCQK